MIKLNYAKSDSRVFYDKLFRLAIPATIQSLMLALVAVFDAFMLGRIDQNAMSAVSLATQIQFIQNMILFSIATSASILGAQYFGKNDRATLTKILHISVKLGVVVSFAFFAMCEFFPAVLMSIFTNEQVLVDMGVNYLKISAFSYLLTGISQSYLSIMKVSEHTKQTAIVSSCAVLINIILNAVFIFGLFGLTPMHERGAALSTTITRVIELAVCVMLSYKKDYINIEFKSLFKFNKQLFGDFNKIMFPLLGAAMFWGIGFTSYPAFMGHLGVSAAAANSVAAVVRDVVCCITDGMAVGGGILIGNELGAGNLELGKEYGDRLFIISFIVGFLSTIIMLLITPFIINFVTISEEAADILKGLMQVLSIYMIGRAVNTVVINGIFSAGGDTLYDMYSLAVCMWCLAVPLAALGTFVFHFSPVVVYACTCLDEVGKIPWTMIHYKKYKWVKDLTRE